VVAEEEEAILMLSSRLLWRQIVGLSEVISSMGKLRRGRRWRGRSRCIHVGEIHRQQGKLGKASKSNLTS